jgi:hypothetical protein
MISSLTSSTVLKDGDSRDRPREFLVHSRPHGWLPTVSDVRSAGVLGLRQPGGDHDVPGGVQIPIMSGAAAWTRPGPGAKAQLGQQVPTVGAGLRAGVPAVTGGDGAPVAVGLVFEHRPELGPSGAGDALREFVVADHSGDVEVLYGDRTVGADDAGAGLVEEVPAGVADLGVCTGDFDLGLGPIRGALLFAVEAPLVVLQSSFALLHVFRVGDVFAGGQDREVLQPEVDTDRSVGGFDWLGGVDVDGEGHEPAPVRIPTDGHGGRIEGGQVNVWPGPHDPQRGAGLRQPQLPIPHPERGAGVRGGLAAVPILEPRVPGALGEERGHRGVLVPQGLLQRNRGDLVQECELGPLFQSGQVPIGLGIRGALAEGVVALVPGGEGLVPDDTNAPERAAQLGRLFGGRVGPTLVRCPHASILPQGSIMAERRARLYGDPAAPDPHTREFRFLPGLKAGASTKGIW